jgi:hypothetical protein
MKRAIPVLMVIFLAGMITSCEKIKSWFDVERDGNLKGTLYIDVEDPAKKSAAWTPFYEQTTIDPLQDKDIAEYEENIKEIKATKVVATVISVTGNDPKEDVIFAKGLRIVVKGSTTVTWVLDQEWNVQPGDEINLDDEVSMDIYGKITDMLSNFETLTITVEGSCNQTGVSVALEVGIDVHFTANPL